MEVLSVLGKVTGVSKVKDAGGKMKQAKNIQKVNVDRFEEQKRVTCKKLNEIEMRKLEILQKFETFAGCARRRSQMRFTAAILRSKTAAHI